MIVEKGLFVIITSVFLFGIVIYTCASAFYSVYERIYNFNNERSESPIRPIDEITLCEQIKMWKMWIQLICRTASTINYCFGWILLISFCFLFVSSTCTTFWIVNSAMNTADFYFTSKSMVDCSFLAYNIIMLSMICFPVASSRLPVGSSATRMDGCGASARASATRCCSPPDSSAG